MNWGSDAAARAVAALLVLLLAREFWLLLRARATSSKRLARFGDVRLLTPLLGGSVLGWRRLRHVCIALSLSMMALALLRPQKQDGTRLRPRSELDVVLVVDESKSMNARDIAPSRIERVKAEVASFVKLLPGVHFGAVAYAGDALALPLTSDGGAVVQFIRTLRPADMPVGGTFTAKALLRARDLLVRERASGRHERRVVLLTDGEDLEGDPIAVAKSLFEQGIVVDVIRVGVSAREPIPATDALGRPIGPEIDKQTGTPMVTEFSAESEAQLRNVASAGGGRFIISTPSDIGLAHIASGLKQAATNNMQEQPEPTYAEFALYPLGLSAFALLLAELLPATSRKKVRQ